MRCFFHAHNWGLTKKIRSDKLRLYTLSAVKRLFEGEDHQHLANKALHQLDAMLLPRPQLGADEEDQIGKTPPVPPVRGKTALRRGRSPASCEQSAAPA